MTAMRLAFLATVVVGCARQHAPANPFADAPPPGPRLQSNAGALGRLEDAVVILGAGPGPLDQPRSVQALRALAQALALVAPASAPAIEDVARRLETAAPTSLAHASLVKEGLETARKGLLGAVPPARSRVEYGGVLRGLADELATLAEASPLDDQRVVVGRAFRSTTNAVFLAKGREPPFQTSTHAHGARLASSVQVELEQARNAILILGRDSWSDGRSAAADALEALVQVVQAASGESTLDTKLREALFQARRLRESQSSFGQSGWVQDALNALIESFERLDPSVSMVERGLLRAARRSVEGIKRRSTLGLERAVIQDAFRATVDAFALSSHASPSPPVARSEPQLE